MGYDDEKRSMGQDAAKKILVVDDDATNRLVVRVLMERRGYIVIEAPSGQEALDIPDLNGPHITRGKIWNSASIQA